MSNIRVDADLRIGEGEWVDLNTDLPISDSEISIVCVEPSTTVTEQVSASSILFMSSAPMNIDLLDGNPQTNVKFLLLLSE